MPSEMRELLSPFIITGLEGISLSETERRILAETPPAGVILFRRNVESAAQLRRLAEEVSSIISSEGGATPLIAADHEGGRISVLAAAIGAHPSQMAAWKPRSPGLLADLLLEVSGRVLSCGINLILAPVADVNSEKLNPVIGTRSFAEKEEEVASAVEIAVKAYADSGMLCCLKHFPGHGSTTLDSHLTLPPLGRTLERSVSGHLLPFAAGIGAGADCVMTAHVATAGGRPPASLDEAVVNGLLRGKMGFDRVVITDALEMAGALRKIRQEKPGVGSGNSGGDLGLPAEAAVSAMEAGSDLLLMSRPVGEVFAGLDRCPAEAGERLGGGRAAGQVAVSRARIEDLRLRATAPGTAGPPGPGRRSGDNGEGADFSGIIASRAVEILPGKVAGSGKDASRAWNGEDPLLPAFLGEKADFADYVVRRFIAGIMAALRERNISRSRDLSLPSPGMEDDLDGFFGRMDLENVYEGKEGAGLFLLRPWKEAGTAGLLVMLMRRPFGAGILREAARGYGMVISAGRPYDAELLEGGSAVIVTSGIYDAAAGAAIRLTGI